MKKIASYPPVNPEDSTLLRDWKRNVSDIINILERPVFSFTSKNGKGNDAGILTEIFKFGVPRNFISLPGETIRLVASGSFSNSASTNKTLKLTYGNSTALGTLFNFTDSSLAGTLYNWHLEAIFSFFDKDTIVTSSTLVTSKSSLASTCKFLTIDCLPISLDSYLKLETNGSNINDVVCNLALVSFKGQPLKQPNLAESIIVF